ncbi:MAG: PTS sugar transporter subunit IIB [Erysipelotrichaceae bacterium]
MIALLRIDDRLLHGQMAISWTRFLKVDVILIANHMAVNDEFTIMSLRLAKPRNVQIVIEDLPQAISYIKQGITLDKRIMVVVKNIRDAQEIIEQVPPICNVNIGGLRSRHSVVKIKESISLNKEDIALCDIINKKVGMYFQEIPEDEFLNYEIWRKQVNI